MRVCPSCGEENPDTAKFCSECATALTDTETPRETRKTVTVLFADMSGSTALGERLDPEALRVVIERYFEAMKAEVERHGGLVEKFIGDAVMAVFGIPKAHEDDALRAIRAAMGLHQVLDGLNIGLERDHGAAIRVRVGINTGEVVTGDGAERQRLVTGDTVNVAARFEQAAPPGEVLIGRETYRLVRDAVEVETLAPLELKGKSEPIPAFRIVRLVEGAAPIARRSDTAFVGRDRERELLADALARVRGDRSCHLFTLLGTAGVGKSRLVAEVLGTESAEGKDVQVHSGRCLPYGDGITFWPVLEIVKSAAGITETDDIDTLRSKLRTTLEGEEDATAIEATLAALLGLAPGGGALEETYWAVRRFLESLARDRPLVVVLDDLHWSAPPLLDLIEHLGDWSRDVPILILCLARPEFLDERPGWGGGKMNATTILLEPFDERDSSTLVENLLETADLPSELTERIVRAAEGNPLFVEELLAMLVDDGSLVREDGRWRQTASLCELTLPSSIQALLAARLDQLEPPELRVIEGGAVVGQVFYRSALAELAPESLAPDVGTYLKSLMRKDLVRPEGGGFPGDETYRFRHILIRDAAYRSMPKRTRAEMHERFADWLERTAGERLHEFEEIVGHHLEQAYRYRTELGEEAVVLANRAHRHLRDAGSRASDRGDVQAAIRLLDSAVMIGAPAERAEAQLELSRAHDLAGDLRAAMAALEEARSLAVDGSSVGLRAELRTIRLNSSLDPSIESFGRSAARIRTIITELEPLDDVLGLAEAWEALGMAEWGPGRFDDAAQAFRTAISYARQTQDPRAARSASFAHCAAMTTGSVQVAEARAEARQTYDALGSGPLSEAFTTTIEADFASMEGKLEEARRLNARSMTIGEDLALTIVVGGSLQTQALFERRVGDMEALAEPARRWHGMTSEAGDVGVGSTAAALLAEALLGLDQLSEAGRLATVAIDTSADDDFASQVGGRRVLALIAARRGDERSARSLIEEAVDRCEGVQWPEEVGNTHLDRAEVMRLLDENGEAIASARRALELYAAKGIRPLEERAGALLASLAVS